MARVGNAVEELVPNQSLQRPPASQAASLRSLALRAAPELKR